MHIRCATRRIPEQANRRYVPHLGHNADWREQVGNDWRTWCEPGLIACDFKTPGCVRFAEPRISECTSFPLGLTGNVALVATRFVDRTQPNQKWPRQPEVKTRKSLKDRKSNSAFVSGTHDVTSGSPRSFPVCVGGYAPGLHQGERGDVALLPSAVVSASPMMGGNGVVSLASGGSGVVPASSASGTRKTVNGCEVCVHKRACGHLQSLDVRGRARIAACISSVESSEARPDHESGTIFQNFLAFNTILPSKTCHSDQCFARFPTNFNEGHELLSRLHTKP